MKKAIIILSILTLFIFNTFPGETDLIQEAFKYIGSKEYNHALELAEKGIKEFGESDILLHIKILALLGLKKYDLAFTFIDYSIKKFGETKKILELKYRALLLQTRYEEAINTALKIVKTETEINYRDCMNIVVAYINLGKKEEALDWLEEAVNLGFIGLNNLESDFFNILKNDYRFKEIIKKIKYNIGIGNKAKDFSVVLLSGDNFVLSQQKGKVILLYFGARDCGACKNGINNLKKYYNEFRNQGFEIIEISLDKDILELKDYIEKENLEWKISFSGKGWDDDIKKLYGVSSIPSYWLIDKNGVLRFVDLRDEELRKAISELILEE